MLFGGGCFGTPCPPRLFRNSHKARSSRFPPKNRVEKDDFFFSLLFMENNAIFPYFFLPKSPIFSFSPPSIPNPISQPFSRARPSRDELAVTSPSRDLSSSPSLRSPNKEEKELWIRSLRGCKAWKSIFVFVSCRRGAAGARGAFGDEGKDLGSWWELGGEGRPFALEGSLLLN